MPPQKLPQEHHWEQCGPNGKSDATVQPLSGLLYHQQKKQPVRNLRIRHQQRSAKLNQRSKMSQSQRSYWRRNANERNRRTELWKCKNTRKLETISTA